MSNYTINRVALFCFLLLTCLTTASAQKEDAEERRLSNLVFKYFDSMDDDAFYKANNDYRNYVREHGTQNQYFNSWNNEIIYDINHDHFYQALKKTEQLEGEIKKAEATDFYHLIDYLMGVFYGTRDNNQLCKDYLQKSLEQTDSAKHNADQVAIYQMLANICIFEDEQEGFKWADKAIAICKSNYLLCGSLALKGIVAFTHDNRAVFDDCYDRLRQIKSDNPKEDLSVYDNYIKMARYTFDGKYEDALKEADSLQSEIETYSFKAVIYKRMGDLKAENQTLSNLLKAKERRNNEISTLTINDISHDLELDKARMERYRAELWFVIILFCALAVIILLLAYFAWSRRRHMKLLKEQNKELQRAKEHAQESDRMKTAFIRNVSHQIRTPLNAISGFSVILAEQVEELSKEERTDLVERVTHNTSLITNSLNHLIALSDVESVRVADTDDPIGCNAFCSEIAQEFKPMNDKVRFSYSTSIPDEMTIKTNKDMLKSIVNELLTNADKFTSEGRILLHSEIEGKYWKITVTDTGVGIKQGEEENIFGHFSKIDDFSEGLGVGLTFCKSIALQMGGNVELDRKYRNGARFIVSIPMR